MSKRILIIEDEIITANNMRLILSDSGYEVTAIVKTLSETLQSFNKQQPDVVLIDVGLNNEVDGISIAKAIRRKYDVAIVFITKQLDEDTFLNAKEVFPENYISKPFTEVTLRRAIALAIQKNEQFEKPSQNVNPHTGFFVLTNDNAHKRLFEEHIWYVEAMSTSSRIYYDNHGKLEVYTVSVSSNNLVAQLKGKMLTRIHKSYYVNVHKIDRIQHHQVFFGELKVSIPVGRAYRKTLYSERLTFLKTNTP